MRFADGSYIEQGFLHDADGKLVLVAYNAADAGTYQHRAGVLVAPGSQAEGGGLVVVSDSPPAGTSYADEVLADAPLAYWRLGEASGTTAVDSSGNGHNGTYSTGVTLGRPGALAGDTNTAASFDGNFGHVSAPFILSPSATSFSVEVWLKVTSALGGVARGIVQQNDGGGTGRSWLDIDTSGVIGCVLGGTARSSGVAPAVNVWHHVVVTYDKPTDTLRFYDNGVTGPVFTGIAPEADTSGTMLLGTFKNAASGFLPAILDEVAIYGTALSAARVTAHYNAGTS